MLTRNIIIVLIMVACAQIVRAQKIDAPVKPSIKNTAAAVDTAVRASTTNPAADAAVDVLSNGVAVDTAAVVSTANTSAGMSDIVFDDDDPAAGVPTGAPGKLFDDDDDELLLHAELADIAVDTVDAIKSALIRREHDHRRQTRLAVIMMVFIGVAMTTTQSWNPR